MKNESIGKQSTDNLTNWAKVESLHDDEIICDEDSPCTTEENWTDAVVCRSREEFNHEISRRGRGKNKKPIKNIVTIRFDADVLAQFKATGNGWQTRMNNALKEWLTEHAV
jgi:uncharacterized protein (DUF4415 family)